MQLSKQRSNKRCSSPPSPPPSARPQQLLPTVGGHERVQLAWNNRMDRLVTQMITKIDALAGDYNVNLPFIKCYWKSSKTLLIDSAVGNADDHKDRCSRRGLELKLALHNLTLEEFQNPVN
ncbi:hypothetical protein J6590_035418 [Homalodisca vitripennis]|nr:hypothetical protein J6590_035418 [Homalodisca vitripennis]